MLASALEWDYYDPCYVKQNKVPKHKHHRPAVHTKQYWVWYVPAVSVINSFNVIYLFYLILVTYLNNLFTFWVFEKTCRFNLLYFTQSLWLYTNQIWHFWWGMHFATKFVQIVKYLLCTFTYITVKCLLCTFHMLTIHYFVTTHLFSQFKPNYIHMKIYIHCYCLKLFESLWQIKTYLEFNIVLKFFQWNCQRDLQRIYNQN